MTFTKPAQLNKLTVAHINSLLDEVTAERSTSRSREDRVAIRVSKETILAMQSVADKLNMRSATSDRVMLPDVLHFAIILADETLPELAAE